MGIKAPVSRKTKYIPTISEIPISRVTYSGDTTVVFFTDGTKTAVKCSSNDTYDRQTAIAYALVKRLFGKLGRYDAKTKKFYENEIDGNGLGTKLEKIAASGFDQDLEKKNLKARKAKAKQEHIARQKKESEAAWNRRVARRAEQIRLEREAEALVAGQSKKFVNESKEQVAMSPKEFFGDSMIKKPVCTSGLVQVDKNDAWKFYRRPNKPFSQFTSQEKREYWNYHNAKRRAMKNV